MEANSVSGPAKNLLAIARNLAESGAGSLRVAVFNRNNAARPLLEACEREGVAAEAIIERRRFDPGVVVQLRALIERHAPNILQSHITKSHFLVRCFGLNRALPWIAFNHGYTAEDLKVRLYNQFDRWSLRGADRVVTVCGAFADRLRRWGVEDGRLSVLHNPVPPYAAPPRQRVEELRGTLGVPAGALVMLSVGRFSTEKAHSDLLRAAQCVQEGGAPPFRLVLVGDGPERGRLEALRRESPAADLIVFAGTTKDVSLYYEMADLFVLPSLSEGSPNALLEAMAAGLPVVATSVGGVPEIVRPGENGLLVPARNVDGLAEAISRMLADRGLRERLGRSGRDWAVARHSPQRHFESILAIYRELLECDTRRRGASDA
jgi:glycosyltransferase involved in cell wall biosynthesis